MNALFPFHPSLQDPATLEELQVGRDQLIADLVARLRETVRTGGAHHTLLVGGRGLGKSFALALLRHRAAGDPELKRGLSLAALENPEWGIDSYLDLLRRILRSLHADILVGPGGSEAEATRVLEFRLARLADQRPITVLLEDLAAVFAGIGLAGRHRLRAFLQNTASLSFVATATSLFPAVQSRDEPFYGFFRIRHLRELDAPAGRRLLLRIAPRWAEQAPEWLRVFVEVAGGNPLCLVLLGRELGRSVPVDDRVPVLAFLTALDALRPRYDADLERLSLQQRQIVDCLLHARHAVTVKEIAEQRLLTHQTVSSQLKTLRDHGIVRSHRVGRSAYYEVDDPLRRACFELGQAQGRRLHGLLSFLRVHLARRAAPDSELGVRIVRASEQLGKGLYERAGRDARRLEAERLLRAHAGEPAVLAAALVDLLPLAEPEWLTQAALLVFAAVWQAATAEVPAFDPALALFGCAIRLREADPARTLLALPLEERKIAHSLFVEAVEAPPK